MNIFNNLLSVPAFWNLVQNVLGATSFKRELYLSRLHPPGKLLDFGCANGHIADAFLDFDYHGVDIDPIAINAAKRRFREKPNMHFVEADIRSRPFGPDYFDEVLFATTIHHLDDETLSAVLKELHYCLKPDGTIHVFDLVRQDHDGWSQKLMRTLDQGKYTRTLTGIVSLIERAGLFDIGKPSLHKPYGALLQDCDVAYLPLRKRIPGTCDRFPRAANVV